MEQQQGTPEWERRFHALRDGERAPAVLDAMAQGDEPRLVWRNEAGGQTWRAGDRFLKWSPDGAGIDLRREVDRLRWLRGRHPVPEVLDAGHDGAGAWFVTAALPGSSAVDERWRADPEPAVRAIAAGLRRVHAIDTAGFPAGWESWASRSPAALGRRPHLDGPPVVVHGDACAPNTLLTDDGRFAATVDVGDLVLGDRCADLAVAAMSLGWNYGPGWEPCFFAAYGVDPDEERMAWYRRLWHAES